MSVLVPVLTALLLAAAIVTESEITIRRAPIEFLEIELATLAGMGMRYSLSQEYLADNGRTRLVDITTHPGPLKAPIDKIHPMPFPGLNIDNLPFFAVIAAVAAAGPQRPEIVLDTENFPTDRYVAEGIAAETGAELVWLEPDPATGVTPDLVAALLTERVEQLVPVLRRGILAP